MEKDLREQPLNKRLPENIYSRVHEDIGTASMCWESVDKAGTFKSEDASTIAFNLCHFIADEIEKAVATTSNVPSPPRQVETLVSPQEQPKEEAEIVIDDVVVVYDRYRFAIPLRAKVKQKAETNDGVKLELLQTNNAQYPIGSEIWVSEKQVRKNMFLSG